MGSTDTADDSDELERSSSCDMSVAGWFGSVKLDGRGVNVDALRDLMYSEDCSAANADVVVLFLSGVLVNKHTRSSLRGLLRQVMENADSYVFNEDDPELKIAGVPAQLEKIVNGETFYSCLYVGVHKIDTSGPQDMNFADTFPVQPMRVRGYEENNEYGMVAQEVLLCTGDETLHLFVTGANLSHRQSEMLAQAKTLERFLHRYHRDGCRFSAVLIGDLNTRLVASEAFMHPDNIVMEGPVSGSKKKGGKKEKPSTADSEETSGEPLIGWLTDEGVADLCEKLNDPTSRKQLFLGANSINFSGKDTFGREFYSVLPGCKKLWAMFKFPAEFFGDFKFEVPFPSFRLTPAEVSLGRQLGFRVRLPNCLTRAQLTRGCAKLREGLEDPHTTIDPKLLYMNEHSHLKPRRLKNKLGDALYVQCGWLDGVGVYKGKVLSELETWDTHPGIMAFDHVPITGMVRISPDGGQSIRVWVGAMKLDNRFPTIKALRHYLYRGRAGSTASGVDVISLYLTDLPINQENVGELRHLLRRTIELAAADGDTEDHPDDFMFNEDDPGHQIKYIPAQLVKTGGQRKPPRYVALYVAVRRALVADLIGNGQLDLYDCFPTPAQLVCRSESKNEFEPNFKSHVLQEVLLRAKKVKKEGDGGPARPKGLRRQNTMHPEKGEVVTLVLVGLNFDTADAARSSQVDRLERLINAYEREDRLFSMVIFGDFNNRLVCWEGLQTGSEVEESKTVPFLKPESVEELCAKMRSNDGRRELFTQKDSWFFEGKDATGREIEPPEACRKLQDLFSLHTDVADLDNLPLPTYKRTPIGELFSHEAGFDIEVMDLLVKEDLQANIQHLHDTQHDDLQAAYFAWDQQQRRVLIPPDEPATLECGWPDSFGIYRHGRGVKTELVRYGTHRAICTGDHVPSKAIIRFRVSGQRMRLTVHSVV